jgi:hypothetical protein
MGVVSSMGQWIVPSTASSNQPELPTIVVGPGNIESDRAPALPGPLQNARAEPSAAVHAYQRSAAPRKVPVKVLTSGQIKASKEEVRTRVRNPTI